MDSIKTMITHFNVLKNYQEFLNNIKVFSARISVMLRYMMILSRLLKMDNLVLKKAKEIFRINKQKLINKNNKV